MRDFKELQVWQKAHAFTLNVYKVTRSFPSSEAYGLTSQLRRSAASIPANIAEGCGRGSPREFIQSCHIALGSACESEYHLILARDLKLVEPEVAGQLIGAVMEIKRMLTGFVAAIRGNSAAAGKRPAQTARD